LTFLSAKGEEGGIQPVVSLLIIQLIGHCRKD
jgi:hypothetical protein